MTTLQKVSTSFVIVGMLFSAGLVHAEDIAVGVSPSKYEVSMKEGQQAELMFHLSRNVENGMFSFEVAIDQDRQILEAEGDSAQIAEGSKTGDFSTILDSSGLEPGDYTAEVNFRDNRQPAEGDFLSIRYGLQAAVELSVLSDADYAKAVTEAGVKLNSLQLGQDSREAGREGEIRYEVQNPGNIYLDHVTHSVTVFDEAGEVVDQFSETTDVDLAPFENHEFQKQFNKEGAGNYTVQVALFYDGTELVQKTVELTVEESQKAPILPALTLTLIIFGAVLMIGGGAMILKKK